MRKNTKPEVLAPAGSTESIYAAVRCGADGIYIGGKQFSARANAVNFSDSELKAAADYCHLHGVKIYRAMNTVIFDSEAEEFCRQVKFTAEAGFDGIIIQDMGAAMLAAAAVPDMPLHCSTQMTVHTPLGAKAAEKCGFCRVVPARELSLENIRAICKTGIETEVFVHGAQCMCLSGQCYMSAMIGGRSANRGQCAQACRLPFSAAGKGEYYALSLKDMSLALHVDELEKAGCSSFKIEGRMKRPEYVAAAVTVFRKAADGEDFSDELPKLEAVFSRSGFTDGYLTGKTGKEMFGSRRKEDVVSAASVLPELAALYKDEKKSGAADFYFYAKAGEPSRLELSSEGVSISVDGAVPEKAVNRGIDGEYVSKQLSKLGGTRYTAGKITCDMDSGLALPAAEINRMRREAVTEADRLITEKNTPSCTVTDKPLPEIKNGCKPQKLLFRIRTERADIIPEIYSLAELFTLPAKICGELDEEFIPKTAAELSQIIEDENKLLSQLETLAQKGIRHFVCGNFTHLGALLALKEKYPLHIHGGTGLNVTNSYAVSAFEKLGLCDLTVSPELTARQITALKKPVPVGFYAYGHFPLMTVKNCPVKAQSGCKKCSGGLTDRTGRFFPVKCGEGQAQILNFAPTETSDKLEQFGGAAFALLDLGGEDADFAKAVAERYLHRDSPEGEFTRGLYFRGVKS